MMPFLIKFKGRGLSGGLNIAVCLADNVDDQSNFDDGQSYLLVADYFYEAGTATA